MATDTKASLARLAARLKGPRGFMVALVVLLLIRILFSLKELGGSSYTIPEPQPFTPTLKLTRDSATYNNVQDLITQWPPFKESKFESLGNLNMFDWKGIAQQEQLDKQANEAYTQAFELFRRGDPESLTRAETLVNEALRISPNHQRSRQLRDQITAARAASGVPAAETGATTATVTQ